MTKRKVSRKLQALMLTLALVMTCMAVPMAAYGAETTVSITVQANPTAKDTPVVYENFEVSSSAAEDAGYTDGIAASDGVSILDVFVAFHQRNYNVSDPSAYLDVGDGSQMSGGYSNLGSIYKIFGVATTGVSYYLNNAPAGVCTSEKVSTGDFIAVYLYGDTVNFTDKYLFFDARTYSITEGEPLELTLSEAGYDASFNPFTLPHADRTVVLRDHSGTEYKQTTDADGKVTFADLPAGEYTAAVEDKGASDYFIMPWAAIAVAAAPTETAAAATTETTAAETTQTEAETTETANADSPATGDEANMMPFIIIALCAAAVGSTVFITRKPFRR